MRAPAREAARTARARGGSENQRPWPADKVVVADGRFVALGRKGDVPEVPQGHADRAMGLSLDIGVCFPQLPDLATFAKALPDLTIILNHLGGLTRVGLPVMAGRPSGQLWGLMADALVGPIAIAPVGAGHVLGDSGRPMRGARCTAEENSSRLPHFEQTSRSRHSGTGVSAPYRSAA